MDEQPKGVFARTPYAASLLMFAVVAGTIQVWRLVTVAQSAHANAELWISSIVLALIVLVVIFAVLAVGNSIRLRALDRLYPDSVSRVIGIYPEAVPQLAAIAAAGNGRSHHVWGNTFAVLWSDGVTVRIFGGVLFGFGGRPQTRFEVTLPSDWTIEVAKAPQGLYNMTTLQLRGTFGGQELVANLLPMGAGGTSPLPYYRKAKIAKIAGAFSRQKSSREV